MNIEEIMRVSSFIISMLFVLTVSAQSDFDIAQEFISKKGIILVDNPSKTRSDDGAVVFNAEDGIGFVIVKDGVVVGYSTENSAEELNFRINTRGFTLTPKSPISPLVEAKWGQGEPFNRQVPEVDRYGTRAKTGCGATALAQVMYYYKNKGCKSLSAYTPDDGNYAPLEALSSTTFDWNYILPKYKNVNFTDKQADEVAKLMKYVGYATKTLYSIINRSGGTYLYPDDFAEPLGFSSDTYSTFNRYGKMSDEELEDLFDRELERNRPIIMAGYNKNNGGHWVVIDGRDDTGRYHINNGANGSGDGYYIISQELFNEEYYPSDLWNMLKWVWCVVPIMPDGWVIPTVDTSIKGITAKNDGLVYNLQGQKVGDSLEGLNKGIYIINGKKYIIR